MNAAPGFHSDAYSQRQEGCSVVECGQMTSGYGAIGRNRSAIATRRRASSRVKRIEHAWQEEASSGSHMRHGKTTCRVVCVPVLLPAYGVEIWVGRRMITHITSRTPRFHASGGPFTPQAADCCYELIADLPLCIASLSPRPQAPECLRACYQVVDISKPIWLEIAPGLFSQWPREPAAEDAQGTGSQQDFFDPEGSTEVRWTPNPTIQLQCHIPHRLGICRLATLCVFKTSNHPYAKVCPGKFFRMHSALAACIPGYCRKTCRLQAKVEARLIGR